MFLFSFSLTIAGTKSSKVLMQKAMKKTLRAPMSFFDTTPIGRIVNRFSKDVDVMDNNLTDAIRMYFFTLSSNSPSHEYSDAFTDNLLVISSVFILIIVYFHYVRSPLSCHTTQLTPSVRNRSRSPRHFLHLRLILLPRLRARSKTPRICSSLHRVRQIRRSPLRHRMHPCIRSPIPLHQ